MSGQTTVRNMKGPTQMQAILLKSIRLSNKVIIFEGTEITIDLQYSVGYADGFHFDISFWEYRIIQ